MGQYASSSPILAPQFSQIMIKEVLEKKGLNVLIGGNAGGGFQGYTQLILEAEFKKTERDYDVMKIDYR